MEAEGRALVVELHRLLSADWDQYDRIAAADKRVAMVLRPDHVYGSALARMREALAQ